MKSRVFFKIAGIPINQEIIPLGAVIGSIVGLGIYTGVTRLQDPHYIRSTPLQTPWKPADGGGKDSSPGVVNK